MKWRVEWRDYRWWAVRGDAWDYQERGPFTTRDDAARWCKWQNIKAWL